MNHFVNAAVVLNYVNPRSRFGKREDAFDLEDRDFRKIFRLTKNQAEELIDDLSPYLIHPTRSSDIDIDTKVDNFETLFNY